MMLKKSHHELWTISKLQQAFKRYYIENGHYPSALEIDACPYLCTSRYIQLKFGGIKNLRQVLNLGFVSYTVGEHRKLLWEKAGRLSLVGENAIGDFLRNRYGEICVHEEKRYGNGRNRLDFFVYASPKFAVEIFDTYTEFGILGNLSMKLKKYHEFPFLLFFVITGGKFMQSRIDEIITDRQAKIMKQRMKCMTQDSFMEYCINYIEPINRYKL